MCYRPLARRSGHLRLYAGVNQLLGQRKLSFGFILARTQAITATPHVKERPESHALHQGASSTRARSRAPATQKNTRAKNEPQRSSPDAVAIDEGRVVGEGSYGVVVAAIDENNKQYVAKRARKDDRSKRYFEVERTINEKLRGTPGLAPYRGVVEGPTPEKQFFDPPTTKYLLFDRVKGGRDAETYLNDGSCGVDGLAAALGLDACAYGDEVCFVDNEEECTADPQQARSGAANVVVASVVLSFLLDACAALEANKVIHRDVKASNILVEPSQKRLVLIDFGSAMDVDSKNGIRIPKVAGLTQILPSRTIRRA